MLKSKYKLQKRQDRLELKQVKSDLKYKKNKLKNKKKIYHKLQKEKTYKEDKYYYDKPESVREEKYNYDKTEEIPRQTSTTENINSKETLNKRKKIKFYKYQSKKNDDIKNDNHSNKEKSEFADYQQEKANYKKAKQEYKVKKTEFKKKYPSKIKKETYNAVSKTKTAMANKVLSQDDDLARYLNAKTEYASKRYALEKSVKTGAKVVGKTTKLTYGGVNRTYNKLKGRGFTRTPKQFRYSTKIKNKIKTKLNKNKKIQKLKKLKQKISKYTKPVTRLGGGLLKNVYQNPLKIKGMLSLLLILFFMGMLMSSTTPSRMNEWNMNESWKYFTKLDRENSNDKVHYYSDIEEYIFYLNYRYDKSEKDAYGLSRSANKNKNFPDTNLGKNYLKGMWDFLNKDKDNLKTINDLMNQKKYDLDEKEKKEYGELINISNEIGKFPYAKELDNFLYNKKEKEYKEPIKILERFGYKTENELSETTTIVAKKGQQIYAPLTGKVTIKDNELSIEQGNKRVTFYNLQNIRVANETQALRQEILGQIGDENKVIVKYEKLKDKEWKAVNIGFYLPSVKYIEKTEVIRDIELNSDKKSIIKKFVEKVKEYIPNATNEGISAVLGNFDIESGINPKRAEGDYLAPPVGAVDENSWDNPEWLDIGGVAIYNGRYPNIVRRGLGLGQWTDTLDGSVRHTLLRDYAKSKDKKWYDLELQVDFIINGDSPYYRNHFVNIVTSNESVEVLTRQFLNNWEGNPSDKLENRTARAKEYYNLLSKGLEDDIVVEGDFSEKVEKEIIIQLNEHRKAYGLPPLQVTEEFSSGTKLRAKEFSILAIRGYNESWELHKRLDGRPWYTAFSGGVLGENLSYSHDGTKGMMDFWKRSASHNAAMLNPAHTKVTVKVLYTNKQYYGVQIFS